MVWYIDSSLDRDNYYLLVVSSSSNKTLCYSLHTSAVIGLTDMTDDFSLTQNTKHEREREERGEREQGSALSRY